MIIDLSHAVENGMAVFPGDPEPRIEDAGAVEPWRVSRLHLGSHTGTHIDAASHYIPGAATIDAYPLERFVVSGVAAPALGLGSDAPIEWPLIAPSVVGLPRGGAVALHTGWDTRWGGDDYLSHPYLSDEAARQLVAAGVGLVAIDALNVDSTLAGSRDRARDPARQRCARRREPARPGPAGERAPLPLRLLAPALDGA